MSDTIDDPQFIQRLKQGSESAFKKIVAVLFPNFMKFIMGNFTLSKEDAEDLIQEVAVKIAKGLNTYDEEKGTFTNWCWTILRNHCTDWLRSKKGIYLVSIDELNENMLELAENPDLTIIIDNLSFIEKLPSQYRKSFIQLKPSYQDILILNCSERPKEECCQILKLNSSNFDVRLHRAKLKWKEIYEGQLKIQEVSSE